MSGTVNENEHSGLFIVGNSVTAEQIEALDQNILEMSICQNHDVLNDGEYMHMDMETQQQQISQISKDLNDYDISRINQYSPDVHKLSNNDLTDIQSRNQIQIENMDQKFKISKKLKEELKNGESGKSKAQTSAEFNFTFN